MGLRQEVNSRSQTTIENPISSLAGAEAADQRKGESLTDMRNHDLETMDFEYLWQLREELTKILPEKIMAEKLELERRLAQLVGGESGGAPGAVPAAPSTRKYPKVLPKYRNPSAPGETWSGRGKQPRWVVKALAVGGTLEDFRIG